MKSANIPLWIRCFCVLSVISLPVIGCNQLEESAAEITEQPDSFPTPDASTGIVPSKTPEIVIPSPIASAINSPTVTSSRLDETELPLTPTETPTLFPTPSVTPLSAQIEPLHGIWPLEAGNYWVSISTNVEFGLSATYIVTDTVMNVREVENLFVVEMQRQPQLVYGDESVEFGNSVKPGDYFYVVSEVESRVNVYRQRKLDLSALDSSELAFVFPLELEECWEMNHSIESLADGCNVYVTGVDDFQPLESGQFARCFSIRVVTPVGRGNVSFCPGIGIAFRDFWLNSNPPVINAGYNETLIDYFIQNGSE